MTGGGDRSKTASSRCCVSCAVRKSGLQYNEHVYGNGELTFIKACQLGLEGIVSKRRGSTYKSGQCRDWLKSKNPTSDAVRREAEENWS